VTISLAVIPITPTDFIRVGFAGRRSDPASPGAETTEDAVVAFYDAPAWNRRLAAAAHSATCAACGKAESPVPDPRPAARP
jgi:hypothetical protein